MNHINIILLMNVRDISFETRAVWQHTFSDNFVTLLTDIESINCCTMSHPEIEGEIKKSANVARKKNKFKVVLIG